MTKMTSPGRSTTCGLRLATSRPVASMLPQSAVGGWVPRPRKDSPAVARIFPPGDGEHDAAYEARVDGEAHDGDGQQDVGQPHDDRLGPGA
jgi:hypothetical protein